MSQGSSINLSPGAYGRGAAFDGTRSADRHGLAARAARATAVAALVALACALTATPSLAAGGPTIVSASQSATQVDVTTSQPSVTVTVAETDPALATATSPTFVLEYSFTPKPGAPPETGYSDVETYGTLTSGTAANGTATFQLTTFSGEAGTYSLNDLLVYSSVPLQTTPLAGTGLQPITAVVSALPTKPTNLNVGLHVGFGSTGNLLISGLLTWKDSGPVIVGATVDSYSSACGTPVGGTIDSLGSDTIELTGYSFGICTVKFRVYNGLGYSPEVSASGLV